MQKEERIFYGRYVWGLHQDFYRDREAGNEWFRLWEELKDEERERYIFIAEAFLSMIRKTESSEILRKELTTLQTSFDKLKATYLKEYKDSGGRQNSTEFRAISE